MNDKLQLDNLTIFQINELSLSKWRPLLELQFYEPVLDLQYTFQKFGVSKICFWKY